MTNAQPIRALTFSNLEVAAWMFLSFAIAQAEAALLLRGWP
jgi:hypothetical protein